MQPDTLKHVKHLLICVILALTAIGIFWVKGKYEAAIADRMAKRDEQISANQAKVPLLKNEVKSTESTISDRDIQNSREVASLRLQLSQTLTQTQAEALIEARLSGAKAGKDEHGDPTTTVSTSQLADTLNKASISQSICDRNLGTCEKDKADLNQAIGKQKDIILADEETIKLQSGQIKDMGRFQVPRHMLLFGVGKSQGSSLQDPNSYQPVIGYGYRMTNRFGFFGLAQNKSAAAGITWNFGSLPK